jgi:hypothetical protein
LTWIKLVGMSALGHKQTFAVQNGMSALAPKADMCDAPAHARFVPKADIGCLAGAPDRCHHHSRKKRGRCGSPPTAIPLRSAEPGDQPWLSGVSRI